MDEVLLHLDLEGWGEGAVAEPEKKGCVVKVAWKGPLILDVRTCQSRAASWRRSQGNTHPNLTLLLPSDLLLGLLLAKPNGKPGSTEVLWMWSSLIRLRRHEQNGVEWREDMEGQTEAIQHNDTYEKCTDRNYRRLAFSFDKDVPQNTVFLRMWGKSLQIWLYFGPISGYCVVSSLTLSNIICYCQWKSCAPGVSLQQGSQH